MHHGSARSTTEDQRALPVSTEPRPAQGPLCAHRDHCANFDPVLCSAGYARLSCPDAAFWRGEIDTDGIPVQPLFRVQVASCKYAGGCPGEPRAP